MTPFLWTLCLLTAVALCCALLAVCPPTRATARAANTIGAAGAGLGCLAGLAALACGPWNATVTLHLSWGLPAGAFTLGLDGLSRLFLLPVFGLGFVCPCPQGPSRWAWTD